MEVAVPGGGVNGGVAGGVAGEELVFCHADEPRRRNLLVAKQLVEVGSGHGLEGERR